MSKVSSYTEATKEAIPNCNFLLLKFIIYKTATDNVFRASEDAQIGVQTCGAWDRPSAMSDL